MHSAAGQHPPALTGYLPDSKQSQICRRREGSSSGGPILMSEMGEHGSGRASDTSLWGWLGNWKCVGCRRWQMALDVNIQEPLLCQAPSLQGGPTLRLCCSLGRGRSLGRPVPFRVQESLRSHLPRAAPGALRSSPSHTSPLWKALLSNGLGAPRHFLAGLYLHFSLCLWSVSPTNIQAPGEQEPVHHRGCVPTAGPAARTLWVLGGC